MQGLIVDTICLTFIEIACLPNVVANLMSYIEIMMQGV